MNPQLERSPTDRRSRDRCLAGTRDGWYGRAVLKIAGVIVLVLLVILLGLPLGMPMTGAGWCPECHGPGGSPFLGMCLAILAAAVLLLLALGGVGVWTRSSGSRPTFAVSVDPPPRRA